MGQLERIAELARQQIALERAMAEAEAEVKRLKASLAQVAEQDLPEAMAEVGMRDFTMEDGSSISIRDDIACGISKAREFAALEWLRKHGHGSLIKRQVITTFGRDEDDLASKVATALQKRYGKERITDKAAVHPQTLKAFLKEQLKEGVNIPLDLFGVFPLTRTTITLPDFSR